MCVLFDCISLTVKERHLSIHYKSTYGMFYLKPKYLVKCFVYRQQTLC
jgi:hypothetical protein